MKKISQLILILILVLTVNGCSTKTKETKKIKVTPKIGKISDLDSDGLNSGEKNPKADCKIVYTVYSIKQRKPQFMRVEIQSKKN